MNNNDKSSEAKFKEISEAYEILSDKEKRLSYDRFGHSGVDGPKGFHSGDPFGASGFARRDSVSSSAVRNHRAMGLSMTSFQYSSERHKRGNPRYGGEGR